jgi:uncharacterized protein YbaR (Trm112 family)
MAPVQRITDPKLLELLVCPLTKGTLTYDAEKQELISVRAKLRYPIRDGIPILLADEAMPVVDPVISGPEGK